MKPKTITVFAQLCNMLPREPLIRISQDQTPSEDGRRFNAQKFNTWDLLCALIFCHLGRCTSLRCIEDGLFTSQQELHHARQAQFLRRSTLSYINNHTNFSILETYYYRVLEHFREALALKFSKTYTKPVFSLDSTTITLCYSLFPWARYRSHKGGFKLHTALNHELLLPEVIDMTAGSVNDVKQAKAVIRQLPPDSIVVMDRGYNDYELFSWLSDRGTTFVTRLKDNALTTPLNNRCLASVPGEWSLHSFEFCGIAARCCEGKSFRLVCWNDTENLRWFRFISNAENLTGPQIAQSLSRSLEDRTVLQEAQAESSRPELHRKESQCRYESNLGSHDLSATGGCIAPPGQIPLEFLKTFRLPEHELAYAQQLDANNRAA